jgi:hypothetical protein
VISAAAAIGLGLASKPKLGNKGKRVKPVVSTKARASKLERQMVRAAKQNR